MSDATPTTKTPAVTKILTGCISAETAFVQPDYPYGRQLRCKRRCWLEYRKGHGFRFVTQTTDPKKSYEKWNKPHASTYADLAVLVLTDEHKDDAGNPTHVDWTTLRTWDEASVYEVFGAAYGPGFDEVQGKVYLAMLAVRRAYDAKKSAA